MNIIINKRAQLVHRNLNVNLMFLVLKYVQNFYKTLVVHRRSCFHTSTSPPPHTHTHKKKILYETLHGCVLVFSSLIFPTSLESDQQLPVNGDLLTSTSCPGRSIIKYFLSPYHLFNTIPHWSGRLCGKKTNCILMLISFL